MFHIEPFQPKYESVLERFVLEESVSRTFLQTKSFLNYHSPSRFKDCSLVVMKDNTISAVIPACEVTEGGEESFV